MNYALPETDRHRAKDATTDQEATMRRKSQDVMFWTWLVMQCMWMPVGRLREVTVEAQSQRNLVS